MAKLPRVPSSPAFLSFQKGSVGGDLHVQGQFGVHQLLVVTQQAGHVLLGLVQGLLQLGQLALGIFEGILTTLLGITDGLLQRGDLREEKLICYTLSYHLIPPLPSYLRFLCSPQ